jgi:prepilin-type N-terminal cleavage/methylation domain-containing protein/prepilin-type processing-associated H-X9-DG protein
MNTRNSAFSLIELLVVIALIAILCALIYPALKAATSSRDETVALSNMHQIGEAFNLYTNDNSYALPSRVTTASGQNKWPGLLAQYMSDVRVFASSYDLQNWVARGLTQALALSNTTNNTSFIMNGYNDRGMYGTTDTPPPVRINQFPITSDIILLGTPLNPTASHPLQAHNTQFYMDFLEPPNGNQYDVLDLAAFNGGSNYLFADGSAKFITEAQYVAPDPANPSQRYGDDLWLTDKTWTIPKVGKGGN